MNDTVENRMKAIEAISGDIGEELDIWFFGNQEGGQVSTERMNALLTQAFKAMGDIFRLAHGYNSTCCKGKGAELIEPAIKSYF